jgi:hypothetical protein
VHGRIGIHIPIPTIVQPITSASKKQRLATYALLDPIACRTAVNVLRALTGRAASQAGGAPTVQQDNFKQVGLGAPTAIQARTKMKMELLSAKVAQLEVVPMLGRMP